MGWSYMEMIYLCGWRHTAKPRFVIIVAIEGYLALLKIHVI